MTHRSFSLPTAFAVLALTAIGTGCAQPGPPPGGPEDRQPPDLLAIRPDSGTVGVTPSRVTFRFDEVVSERGPGNLTIEQLFLISPRDGEPRVEWRRRDIRVRPRRGWRPNTVYTVRMLPGVTDLRGNVMRQGVSMVFSTGGPIPATRVGGVVFEWASGKPAPRAFVEAIAPDSTIYVTATDSSGRFELDHIPSGGYTIRATIDGNGNRALDPREAWDTTRITLVDFSSVELAAFVHDSLGPRIANVTLADSVTLRVVFDKPVDVTQTIDASSFALLAADSTPVPIVSAVGARRAASMRDSVRQDSVRAAADRADSAAAADTSARAPRRDPAAMGVPLPARPVGLTGDTTQAPRMTRPLPEVEATVVLGAPLVPEARYRLRAVGIRSLEGIARTSDRVFAGPRGRAASDTTAGRDTSRTRPDTTAPPATTRPPR